MVSDEQELEKLKANLEYLMDAYMSVMEILENCKDEHGVSHISQSEIARRLGVSQTAIAKRFKNLIRFGAVKKIGYKNAYMLINKDILNNTPLGLLAKLMIIFEKAPDIRNDYYKQAELMKVSYRDVQVAWGYLTFVIA